MRGVSYTPHLKHTVLALGASGATYSEIQKKYCVPKSTLSYWFKSAGRSPTQNIAKMREHLTRAREIACVVIQKKKEARLAVAESKAQAIADTLPLANIPLQKSLLAMLYWAEGTKSDKGMTIFTNTDPLLISFYLHSLRSSFALDETKLRIRLHLHHYHNKSDSIEFWSELLKVPKSQFGKIHVKKRSTQKKFRENFRGICFVIYNDVSVRRELMALGRLLAQNKIKKLSSFNG